MEVLRLHHKTTVLAARRPFHQDQLPGHSRQTHGRSPSFARITEIAPPGRSAEDALGFLRYVASLSHLQEIHFLWRPFLPDANDDMVLELAFAAGCRHIITHNVKDFRGCEELGVTAQSPGEFLKQMRKKP